jgi:sugar phosphate isomerase/epimerase
VATRQLARFAAVTDRWRDRLRYTAHGPFAFWLLAHDETGLRRQMLQAGMEATRAFGAELMVYDTITFRHPWPGPAGLEAAAARDREMLQQAADEAATWGGLIAVETSDDDSHAGAPDLLAEQIALIDRPNVGICIDTGHSLIASCTHGWDYVAGIAKIAAQTITFHLEDNFGRKPVLSDAELGEIVRLELGIGDLHLPVGWGAVPFERVFAELDFPRRPILMLEIDFDTYRDVLPEQIGTLQRWAEARRSALAGVNAE